MKSNKLILDANLSDIVQNVFPIKNGKKTGTCFKINHGTKQYFITAKHIIDNINDGDCLEFLFSGIHTKANVKIIGHHPRADVSAFTIDHDIGLSGLEYYTNKIEPGQEAYFMGFPTRAGRRKNNKVTGKYPHVQIKKATISKIIHSDTDNYLLLNGKNNPGFSGGPVLIKDPSGKKFKVTAIVSGSKRSKESVQHKEKVKPISLGYRTGII
ncbi:MAG: S1 family peptidase, partial [bacterium]